MFCRAAVPPSDLRALRALIAPASTAAQNQQPKNLQKECCTNNGLHGRVVDIDVFATTLLTLDDVNQLTGKVAEFPNGLLLTTPLTNVSLTGEYILHAIRIPIPESFAIDMARVEAAAMEAAEQATELWREEAIAHFRKVSEEHFIAFPSGKNKILWDFSDPDHLVLVVRVACPSKERSKVEQLVFKDMWQNLAELRQ